MIVTFASSVTGGLPAVTIGPTTDVVTTGGRFSASTVTPEVLKHWTGLRIGDDEGDGPAPTTAPAVVENVTARKLLDTARRYPFPRVKTPVAALYEPVID